MKIRQTHIRQSQKKNGSQMRLTQVFTQAAIEAAKVEVVVFLVLVKITLVDAYICLLLLCESVLLHVCTFMQTVILHSSGLYT